jgi:BirA family biotin operon repressor/biotin-[acetyl-CoA-carboxylase] ligase
MATPYLQLRRDTVASTQDIARAALDDLPVLVLAAGQTEGRGRDGREWVSADRALAASFAFRVNELDARPFSLMAGVAAVRATEGATLKWPNDVLVDSSKVGGILVERSGSVVVVGMGLNLWWATTPEGMSGLFEEDPGIDRYAGVGGLWGAELMSLVDGEGWPIGEYRESCGTLGQEIRWEPDGEGVAVDIAADGALVVMVDGERMPIRSGEVHHVRG